MSSANLINFKAISMDGCKARCSTIVNKQHRRWLVGQWSVGRAMTGQWDDNLWNPTGRINWSKTTCCKIKKLVELHSFSLSVSSPLQQVWVWNLNTSKQDQGSISRCLTPFHPAIVRHTPLALLSSSLSRKIGIPLSTREPEPKSILTDHPVTWDACRSLGRQPPGKTRWQDKCSC